MPNFNLILSPSGEKQLLLLKLTTVQIRLDSRIEQSPRCFLTAVRFFSCVIPVSFLRWRDEVEVSKEKLAGQDAAAED